ncbi:MAG: slipin family protein, partial [Dehalococcoidia bacterium]
LQTLAEIATEKNSTIVFPVPIDLLNLITHDMREATAAGSGPRPRVHVDPDGGGAQAATPLTEPPSHEGTVS